MSPASPFPNSPLPVIFIYADSDFTHFYLKSFAEPKLQFRAKKVCEQFGSRVTNRKDHAIVGRKHPAAISKRGNDFVAFHGDANLMVTLRQDDLVVELARESDHLVPQGDKVDYVGMPI